MNFLANACLFLLFSAAFALTASQFLPKLTPRQLAVNQLVNASRILALQGIADDSLGHISVRDPLSPNTAFLITAGSSVPAHVTPADIAVVRINDSVVTSAALSAYPPPKPNPGIFIHSSIYQRFPNTTVSSIAYYAPEQLLPFALFPDNSPNVTSTSVTPEDLTGFYAVTSGAAFLGAYPAPVYSVFDAESGATSVTVDNAIKGYEMAQKFGPAGASSQTVNLKDGFRPLVLMRNDGATMVGATVPETVFRFVQAVKNARVLYHFLSSTDAIVPQFLPAGVATEATDNPTVRSWLLWMSQIEASIKADSARSPELWEGDSVSNSSSVNKNHGAHQQPFAASASILAVCVAIFNVMLYRL
ncbi:uncharacterized protein MEPE_06754 [Melanopsichium pennsylvanicum]|uniref:Class II aldolase/adducin N-terminal domain-containing protein n=2 Tax=Melanopsichium pennsylvanicum TaxID=63383 RepID=A0AAJ4XUK1_9BASI|nr:conserved hypothetical protein [Melanopsichium pennsylvanicum 4]SNX88043.1 uncharacterized protein MEPE_06754 [Melanopsichium pennsylvanicum]